MHKKLVLIVLLACAIGIWFAAAWMKANSRAIIDVEVSKTEQGEWFVAYDFDESIERVTFIRNPDTSRLQRWIPIEPDYYLAVDSESGNEYVARSDGQAFSSVAFALIRPMSHYARITRRFQPLVMAEPPGSPDVLRSAQKAVQAPWRFPITSPCKHQ